MRELLTVQLKKQKTVDWLKRVPRSGTIRVKSPRVELEHLTYKEIAEITGSEVLAGQDGLEKGIQ